MSRHHKVFFAAAALGAAAIGFLGACTSPQPSPWAPPKPIDPMGERSAGSPASDRDPDGSHSPAESSRPESGSRTQRVYFGIDHLEGNRFRELKGKRIGLITNQTSINRNRVPTRKVLQDAPQIDLVALFVPEHGIDGKEQASRFIPTRKDPLTGLTAYSLYGPTRKPTKEMLDGLDVLAFDLQDIGSRSYTYLSTMILAMGACGEHGVEFAVFDRPNPLGGERVCGPPMEKDWISFVGQFPAPYCHGMTAGELAMMANAEGWTTHPCDISIIRMRNWRRNMTWDDTGLPWVATSPNIPRSDSPLYYASTGIFGSLTGGDIGIGTRKPFEIVGAPGISTGSACRESSSRPIGVCFVRGMRDRNSTSIPKPRSTSPVST